MGLCLVFSLAGCGRREVTVYEVAKDASPASSGPAAASSAQDPHAGLEMAMPSIKWTKLPDGWTVNPNPGSMRAASFLITGKDNQEAELGVIPLGGMTGMDLQLVNMWRGQVKLPEVTESDLASQSAPVKIGNDEGRLFEMASTVPIIDDKQKGRIMVAMLKKEGTTWFFKLAGEDSFVASQKSALEDFLKGVSFVAAPALPAGHPPMAGGGGMGMGMMGGGATVPPGSGDHPAWQVPASWTEVAHSPFLVAKFEVAGDGGAKADINVSMSPGDGGGLLPNVNRWRGQLSLGAVDEAALSKLVSDLDLPAGKATLIDFSGSGAENGDAVRCVAIVLPLNGNTWFYKIMGGETLVAREKDQFLKFVQSAKY
jgi:hypothetical protein